MWDVLRIGLLEFVGIKLYEDQQDCQLTMTLLQLDDSPIMGVTSLNIGEKKPQS